MSLTDSGTSSTRVVGSAPYFFVTAGGAWVRGDPIGLSGGAFVRADDDGSIPAQWIAGSDADSGEEHCKLYAYAICTGDRYSGGVVGAQLYLSNTAGRVSESAGSTTQTIGVTVAPNSVFLAPVFQHNLAVSGYTFTSGTVKLNDDLLFDLGSDGDNVLVDRSTVLNANTALTAVVLGTPVVQATPANSLLVSNVTANGDIVLLTNTGGNSLEALRVDASAQQIFLGWGVLDTIISDGSGMIVGAAAQVSISNGDGSTALIPEVQVLGTTKTDASLLLAAFNTTDTTTVAPSLNFLKSGHATIGSNTVVAASEVLGEITWLGADGTDFNSAAARIAALVDTTPGAGDMPGRLVFSTTIDGGETLTEALRIDNAQRLIQGAVASQTVGGVQGTRQQIGTAAASSFSLLGLNSVTDAAQAEFAFLKSGNATPGSFTIVANAELLGQISWYADDGTDYATPAASIRAIVSSTPGANDLPASIIASTTADGANSVTERLRVNHVGNVAIGDGTVTSHAAALGPSLIIDQLGNDDVAIALKSSTDVSTGLTTGTGITDVAVNDYLTIGKFAGATGGALITAIGENAAVTTNLRFESYGGQAAGTHTTAGRSLIEFYASQHDGANALADLGNATNILGIAVRTGSADVTRFMVDENGEIYNDGTVTAYDEYDDLALVRAVDVARSSKGLVLSQWDAFVDKNEADLVAMGILGAPRSEGGLLNVTRLQKLHSGALWQLASDLMDLAAALPAEAQAKLSERMRGRLAAVQGA